jgi:hypothetical protein
MLHLSQKTKARREDNTALKREGPLVCINRQNNVQESIYFATRALQLVVA